jgi:hypothetical protein
VKTIRGGMGLGDAFYVQAVARHLVKQGQAIRAATAYPDVFRPLGIECIPFTRQGIQILAHYSLRKGYPTGQFEDCCIQAGIREPVDLKIDWEVEDAALTDRLRSHGKPIVMVQLPRNPMGRTDGFGSDLLPDCNRIQLAIDALQGRALLVQVGAGRPLFKFTGIDVDLANETTLPQLLDIAAVSFGAIGYVSFMLPLCESLGKRALLVWSRKGLQSQTMYVRQITPEKVIHRKDLVVSVNDGAGDDIESAVEAFLRP